ncbi:cytidine deaminase [Leeia sp.]|uniref:cytidine deaminase n=1 Tax=Leeia sp. TaxID=2884678 RepID=UPI0035B31ECC
MDRQALVEAARLAREGAYVPYSRFQVGAALRTHDGRVFTGCNIENASYPLCNCAERTALFSAIAAGMRPGEVAELAVIGDTEGPISPCGACRQVMLELCAPDTPVILANLGDARLVTTVGELLPFGFSGRDLGVV